MADAGFDPAAAAREVADLQRRLARGLGVLRDIGDVRPGATPREAVLQMDGITLYRYGAPDARAANAVPLLIVYALVNRPDMADLERGRSLIGGLLERGFDVYLVDWGTPGGAERERGLADYLLRYLDACVDHVRAARRRERVPLLGICQGGTFSVCYTALRPDKVERLVTTVTPIDFHTPDDTLSHLVRHVDLDLLVDASGNVSGDVLNALFLSLKPFRLTQQKYLRLIEQLDDPETVATFLRMEQWIFDSPALTARACREFGRGFYQENRLVEGSLSIGGERVEPAKITVPVLNIYARADHLVPPASSRALRALLPNAASYAEHELGGGHIGVYVSARSGDSVPARVAEWFADDQKETPREAR